MLGREDLFVSSKLQHDERFELLDIFVAQCEWTPVYYLWRPNLPDEKHRRLKALAKSRGTPLNRLVDELTTQMLAEFDAETRFTLRAVRGAGQEARGLELLNKAMGV